MANDVIYRRINGRIVPIRKKAGTPGPGKSGKANTGKIATGAALIGSGVTASVYAGKFAAKSVLAAAAADRVGMEAATRARSIFKSARAAAIRIGKRQMKSAQLTLPIARVDDFVFKKGQETAAKKLSRVAMGSATNAARLFRNRKTIRGLGVVLGAGLITAGLRKVYEGATGNPGSTRADITTGAGGTLAALSVRTGYVKDLNLYKKSGAFKQAIAIAIKGFKFTK